jgi:small subunit ribosomal protein S4
LGFASSRKEARHLVHFGHILVNGKRVDVPSYQIKEGDAIEVAQKSRKIGRINQSIESLERRGFPGWLELDKDNYKGVVRKLPLREDVTLPIEEQLIVEFYSRV